MPEERKDIYAHGWRLLIIMALLAPVAIMASERRWIFK